MLDLFAGLGGASAPMRDRGWSVVTVDHEPACAPSIVADVKTWHWNGPTPDLLWASPPCEEFAREFMPWSQTGTTPSLDLVTATLTLVASIQPRWWVLENVVGAQRYLGRAPRHYGAFYLWGWYPPFECDVRQFTFKESWSSMRAAERGRIPYTLGDALASAIEAAT